MVIERGQVRAAFKETGLRKNAIIDTNRAQIIGKILGVDWLVIGTVTDLVQTIDINARIISAQTGQITAVARSEIEKSDITSKLSTRPAKSPSRAQLIKKRNRANAPSRCDCEDKVSFQDNLRNGYTP